MGDLHILCACRCATYCFNLVDCNIAPLSVQSHGCQDFSPHMSTRASLTCMVCYCATSCKAVLVYLPSGPKDILVDWHWRTKRQYLACLATLAFSRMQSHWRCSCIIVSMRLRPYFAVHRMVSRACLCRVWIATAPSPLESQIDV